MWFLATTCLIELCLVLFYAFARNWSHAFMQQRIQATNRKTSIIIFECENITLVPIIDKSMLLFSWEKLNCVMPSFLIKAFLILMGPFT